MQQSIYISKIVNDYLCIKGDNFSFIYSECYCIGNTPENNDTLEIHVLKTYNSNKKITPNGNSVFSLNTRYPLKTIMQLNMQLKKINLINLSQNDLKEESISAKLYIFVKRNKLQQFIEDVLNNDKPGAVVVPSEYGSIIYTMLYTDDFVKYFDEETALTNFSRIASAPKNYPEFRIIHKQHSIISKLLNNMKCISQNNLISDKTSTISSTKNSNTIIRNPHEYKSDDVVTTVSTKTSPSIITEQQESDDHSTISKLKTLKKSRKRQRYGRLLLVKPSLSTIQEEPSVMIY
ncbi:DUF3023 domain-containing protein [Ehrlichia canis]|uniref:Uncharacterized protein n=1 Tax=Ehrlichia canis (strain Jake) TaxID=269484 RepID=A0ACA6AVU2_EHRCJ|nr:DUF3023 domain-containing protein [Ehrlichia canis]AAZ68470.1 hypothetical protein Ecaj_0428 [Ehrlichia canis str. Jake]AUO54780.1 DUF3023 domain-containing protein [Ehrlichia canis]UKC53364.1 DUF3023 domain-containing protein [Ehrlichia canis]UKC54300.1 DUF3023 domain-containing protein [Ehrlichia canis]UKC55236.1 DUF3023 domain-containing protein [Ehrlichia canis]